MPDIEQKLSACIVPGRFMVVHPGGVPLQPSTMFLTILPEGVRSASVHAPVELTPFLRMEDDSTKRLLEMSLSFNAQLQLLMLFCFMKATHSLVEASSTNPSPCASQVPHSVTNSANPRDRAVLAFVRKLALCEAA